MLTDAYPRLLESIHRADLLSRRVADRSLTAEIGTGRAMFLILDLVAASERAVSQQEIADRLGLTRAAVSRHIAIGRDRGWIRAEASPASRRENEVVLTPDGRVVVERGRRRRDDASRLATAELGDDELRRTAQSLQRLCSYLEDRLRDR